MCGWLTCWSYSCFPLGSGHRRGARWFEEGGRDCGRYDFKPGSGFRPPRVTCSRDEGFEGREILAYRSFANTCRSYNDSTRLLMCVHLLVNFPSHDLKKYFSCKFEVMHIFRRKVERLRERAPSMCQRNRRTNHSAAS